MNVIVYDKDAGVLMFTNIREVRKSSILENTLTIVEYSGDVQTFVYSNILQIVITPRRNTQSAPVLPAKLTNPAIVAERTGWIASPTPPSPCSSTVSPNISSHEKCH